MPSSSVFVLLALLAGPPTLPSPTGKVALEGALTANELKPAAGSTVYVYLNVTPLIRVASLELRLELTPALEAVLGDGSLSRSFGEVEPGQTVTLSLPVRVVKEGEQVVRAAASLNGRGSAVQARSFLLALNPGPKPEPKATRGTNGKGEKLIIYDEERSATPPPGDRP
jgi:hypothetical protein